MRYYETYGAAIAPEWLQPVSTMKARDFTAGIFTVAMGLLFLGSFTRSQDISTPAVAAPAPWLSQFPRAISALPLTYHSIRETGTGLNLPAWLSLPPGSGRFPAVIFLSGCNGLWGARGPTAMNRKGAWSQYQFWSQRFVAKGYATLTVDSFTPRGYNSICIGSPYHRAWGESQVLERAIDVYAAAAFLATLPQIEPRKIVAMGDSNGGATVLQASNKYNAETAGARNDLIKVGGELAAVIALYPGCGNLRAGAPIFSVPALVLQGTGDGIVSPEVCEALTGYPAHGGDPVTFNQFGAPVTIVLYTGATHSFDVNRPPRAYGGTTLVYDAASTAKSQTEILNFLDRNLK
jgi:dienelactone hydrolase